MSEALLSARGVTKVYALDKKPVEVLKGVDLDLSEGEIAAVIGASGTGKSTMLSILGTLDVPTSGTVLFEGKDTAAMDESARAVFRNRHLGFVFQFGQLLPEFTAEENAAMPLLMRGDGQAVRRARAMLDRVGLSHRLRHRPGELSGGEQQRVAIARALVGSPRLILADEPTGNLDSHTGDAVFDLLLELATDGNCGVLVVTHNDELAGRCHRIVHMVDGRIAQS